MLYCGAVVATVLCAIAHVLWKVAKNVRQPQSNGLKYWLKWLIARILLHVRGRSAKGRFHLYDYSKFDVYKCAVLPPEEEYDLEAPRSRRLLGEKCDDVTVWGSNADGECLLARIRRHVDFTAEVWLYFRTAQGDVYVLPDVVAPDLSRGLTYSAGGLLLEMLIPMRRWRVAYNGFLRCASKGGVNVHVKLGFVCNTTSNVVDYSVDCQPSFLAHQLAEQEWPSVAPDVDSIFEQLDSYMQTVWCVGSVTVENEPEREVFLWGLRVRRQEDEKVPMDTLGEVMGYTKSGLTFYLREVLLHGLKERLQIGMLGFPSTDVVQYANCTPRVMTGETSFEKHFHISAEKFEFVVRVNDEASDSHDFPIRKQGRLHRVTVEHYPFLMDTYGGNMIYISPPRATQSYAVPAVPTHIVNLNAGHRSEDLVLDFHHPQCQNVASAGGKGSSLAILADLVSKDDQMTVPEGIVVTTAAYDLFLREPAVKSAVRGLEDATSSSLSEFAETCASAVDALKKAPVPDAVQEAVEAGLRKVFHGDAESLQFAVRSSATGEDSEDMSAAGQMESVLGVSGITNIVQAISACWASQFTHIACGYKRRYGQPINAPMAVVVQRMVPSEVAGVMFTRDMLTGNPRYVVITANYGLGESVVSGRSEPDTILLERNDSGNLDIKSIRIGTKQEQVVLDDEGTKQTSLPDQLREKCCLSEKEAKELGMLGLKLEEHFCGARDIEWARAEGRFYILQSRAVTSFLQETDCEIMHETDYGFRTSDECLSKANIGEVMSGAQSPMCSSLFVTAMFMSAKLRNNKQGKVYLSPYHDRFFINSLGNMFFPASSELVDMGGSSLIGKGIAYAFRGGVVHDSDVERLKKARTSLRPKRRMHFPVFELISRLWHCKDNIDAAYQRYSDLQLPVHHLKSSERIFRDICGNLVTLSEAGALHNGCNMYSTMSNVLALALLAYQNGEWNDDVISDFANLMASCEDVVSADVPRALQEMAVAIADHPQGEAFKKLEVEEALQWLQNGGNEVSRLFGAFLQKHGHRCLNAFDPYSRTWAMDPKPVVRNLQALVGTVDAYNKKYVSVEEALDGLKITLPPFKRKVMKVILDKCRKGVAHREHSKNLFVKAVDIFRRAMRYLAERMVVESRLPDQDLLFFLTLPEIGVLLRTRSPKLVARAIRRQRLLPVMRARKFEEIVKGIPRAIVTSSPEEETSGKKCVKGTAVSRGVVVGPARVASSIEEAASIEKGDILVTYGTDIAWSPYFPLLAGVATELGGLISHGAVVAREYGLPCIVGAKGATSVFRSGDIVKLDADEGTLHAIQEEQ